MTIITTRDSLFAKVKAALEGMTTPTPITWANVDFNIDDADGAVGFVRVTMTNLDGEIAALGNNFARRSGQIVCQCFIREGEGTDRVYLIAETIQTVFETYPSSNERIRDPGVNDIGQDETGWYMVNVFATFEYDVIHS